MFSKPEVIALIREGFIPVALKAASVENPPVGIEGQIYRELRRTRAAAQGICVMNSAGQALAWSLSFDDDGSVLEFFDQAKKQYAADPDHRGLTKRYRRFPSVQMDDVADEGRVFELPIAHGEKDHCPGDLPVPEGAINGRIVGRACGDDGEPLPAVRSQDNYVEDIFTISEDTQDQLLAAAKPAAEGASFELPKSLAREFVENAYLGMLDVNPLGGDRVRAKLIEDTIKFTAVKQSSSLLIVSGSSRVAAKNRDDIPGDAGRIWSHQVDLDWHGFIEIDGQGVSDIALMAHGDEELSWGGPGSRVSEAAKENPVAFLLGGRPIDMKTRVRYGLRCTR